MSNRQTASSHSTTPSENKIDDNNDHSENNTEPLQVETTLEPNTNPTDNTQKNPLQIPESSYSEIFTGQRPNPSVDVQQQFCEVFFVRKNSNGK